MEVTHIGKKVQQLAAASAFGLTLALSSNAHALDEWNVINITPRDYVDLVGKRLSDYGVAGVHAHSSTGGQCVNELVRKVNKKFPNAEVVVNFQNYHDHWGKCYGTVLIPKK